MKNILGCWVAAAVLTVSGLHCAGPVDQPSPAYKTIDAKTCATPDDDPGYYFTGGVITADRCSVCVVLKYCTGIVFLQMVNTKDSLVGSWNFSSVPACSCKTCTGISSSAVITGLRPQTPYVLKFLKFWGTSSRECDVPCTTVAQ